LLALSPSFRLLIAHGYSDMVTPYSDSRYVLLHLPNFASQEGEPGNQERAELKLYRGGHMFYLDPASRKAFTADARTVYASP
jgi:carboxypeptidase C (cathepsin A)